MTPAPAYLDRILDAPRPDPFPRSVHAIACAGYVAAVAEHPQPTPWERLSGKERHRWLQAADFLMHLPGQPNPAGIRAVYMTGGKDTVPFDGLGTQSQRRWRRVTAAMVDALEAVMSGLPAERTPHAPR